MKTKHILTALALPTMFAACTADDIVSENNAMQQAERAKLSKDFVLNTNNEIDSRYAVEGTTSLKFNFEEGDLIGANLIDSYEPGEGYAYTGANKWDKEDPATWKITQTVAPALPFVNAGGDSWKSAGELGIGNYLFTNPYNPEDKNRAAAKYELPIVVQYDSKNPNAHIEAYNKAVAATILREGDTEADINLKNIFAYPKVRINFPKADEVSKITKIVLQREGEFIYKGALNHSDIVAMFNEKNIEAALKADKDLTVADYWAAKTTGDFVIDGEQEEADNANYATIERTPYFVYEMDEKVTSNSFDVRLMLPSIPDLLDVDAEDEIVMFIITDKGNYQLDLTDVSSYTFKSTTLAAQKTKALWRNTSNTLNVNAEALKTVTDKEIEELLKDNIVSTVADWNALVEKYGDLKKYSAEYNALEAAGKVDDAEQMIVTILGDEFALTSDLKMPEIAEFIINSSVNVEGAVTLKNIKVQGADVAVTVKEGSTLTTDQTFFAPTVNVEEGAELIFSAAYNAKKELVAYTGITTVNNEGTVTVPAGVEATFTMTNNKGGIVNVEKTAVANLNAANNGKIVNNGTINVLDIAWNEDFANEAASEAAGYEKNEAGEFTEWPLIENNGEFNVKGTMNNESEFVNNATLSSNFSGASFANTGVLKVATKTTTYIDNNAGGKIILSELNPADFTIHGAKGNSNYANTAAGTIEYTMTKAEQADVKLGTSPVTYLIANGDVTLNGTFNYTDDNGAPVVKALPTLVVNGGEVKVSKAKNTATTPAYVAQVTNLIVNSGKATIGSEIVSVANITVKPNASLTILETGKVTLTGNYTIENAVEEEDKAGVLYVDGKLHMSGKTTTDGKYLIASTDFVKLGKDVVVTCAAATDTSLQDAYNASVADFWSVKAEYNNFLKPDMTWYATALVRNHSWQDQKALLTKVYGTEAKVNEMLALETEEKKIASVLSKLTAANFEAARTAKIYTSLTGAALTTFKNTFIKDGNLQIASEIEQNDKVFETETEAYESVLKHFNKTNTDTRVNVWNHFTATDVKNAMLKETCLIKKNVKGAYAFIWKGCALDQVVSVMKELTPAEWATVLKLGTEYDSKTELYTIDGVKAFLKAAYLSDATSGAASAAKTVAATYYSASKTWNYSTDQVGALIGGSRTAANFQIGK